MSDDILDQPLTRWRETIARFHTGTYGVVLVTTGGGSSAIAMLQSVPGASATLLEAQVPYCNRALDEFLGSRPDQYCAATTALDMAVSAYRRARHLSGRPDTPVIGVSCTASLVSQRPKRGEHRAYIAVQTPTHTCLQTLKLQRAIRDRQTEELLVGEHVLRGLVQAVDVPDVPQIPLGTGDTSQLSQHTADPLLASLWHKRINHVWAGPDGRMHADLQPPVSALLCGSFNPLHAAHTQLREVSQCILGRTVGFELSITNA
ncbi:MAG: hypothetical protein ABGZ17_06640, partial [Planctomycetaceae bacterium]